VISLPKEKFCNKKKILGSFFKREGKLKTNFFAAPFLFSTNFLQLTASDFVAKAKQLQTSPTSIGSEMNAGENCFSAGVQTSAEIEEPSLRTPRPVTINLQKHLLV